MKRVGNGGFTLLEVLVVVVIIGILAALATPTYFKAVEKSKGAEAFINLGALREAMIRQRMEEGSGELDIEHPNDNPKRFWEYSGFPFGKVGDPTWFGLEATRKSGRYKDSKITLDSDGVWGGNWPWIPGR